MSSLTLTGTALLAAQQTFEAALPAMDNVVRHFFRSRPAALRAELIADARAAVWAAWYSLTRRGKDPVQLGVTGIAAQCCRFTSAGRRLGTTRRGRGCLDILDHRARRRLGIDVISLDGEDEATAGEPADWREWLAADNRVTPADEAAFRLDFARWLAGLPERKKTIAELLLEGHATGTVAQMLEVTPAAISQTRTWLESSWRAFQGESTPIDAAGTRPVGRPRKTAPGARRGLELPMQTPGLRRSESRLGVGRGVVRPDAGL